MTGPVTGPVGAPEVGFALAAVLHLGFQGTVTLLVYPALARVGPGAWDEAHLRHSRAVVPAVVLTYAALLAASVWLLAAGTTPLSVAAVVVALSPMAVTALAAAPIHGRLRDPDPVLLRRLLLADRLRAFGALAGAVLALVLLATG